MGLTYVNDKLRGEIILRAEVEPDGGFVFSVADTGIGIAPGNVQTVLGTFGQVGTALKPGSRWRPGWGRQVGGAGSDLPLTEALAEVHGGWLELDSEIGVGATVTLRFPAELVMHATGLREDGIVPPGRDLAAS